MIRGSITERECSKKFLETVKQFFAKNDKVETSSTLSKTHHGAFSTIFIKVRGT
jgi:hypothetical protein